MKREVFTYLQSYSFDPLKVDRLIVSAFLYSIGIKETNNALLGPLLIKEDSEEYEILMNFLEVHVFSGLEEIIEVFEFVISPEEKIVTGAVYTPRGIREYIVEQCFSEIKDLKDIKVCDPACGCAGFLYTVAVEMRRRTGLTFKEIFKQNIFGLDIQRYSVIRSKLLLSLLAISEGEDEVDYDFNLFQGNALCFDWSDTMPNYTGFDIVIGNPPYVCSRNIDEESKQYIYDWRVSGSGHPDLYIPFFQIGIENLKSSGMLGFITMNTFFKSVNGKALRLYFGEKELALKILDFGGHQVFQSKSTYTCICIVQNKHSKVIEYARGDKDSLRNAVEFDSIYYVKLNHQSGWNLQETDVLSQIESVGTPFGELYRTRNGVATLKNRIYIFDPIGEDADYYFLQNGNLFPIEKGICREIVNPNKLPQDGSIKEFCQKVIFPYRYDEEGRALLIAEKEFKLMYPKAYKYLRSQKSILATRDKGKGVYKAWYAYGRNQSLEKYKSKLFFPHITAHIPNCSISTDENLLFYNGIAVVSDDESELRFLQKIMRSRIFWYYIVNSSKPYGSGYFSLSRNYIKGFGIYDFTDKDRARVIKENDVDRLNNFLESMYGVCLRGI